MGKTVPSYRMALEMEIARWRGFRKTLTEADKEAFDELMDMCRSFGMASGNACNPILFDCMAMSIMLAQENKLRELEYKINKLQCQENSAQNNIPSPSDESILQ
jgi:hypothetical protein